MEKDPINGMVMIKYLAMIAAWVGEKISPANSLPLPSACRLAVRTSAMAN